MLARCQVIDTARQMRLRISSEEVKVLSPGNGIAQSVFGCADRLHVSGVMATSLR